MVDVVDLSGAHKLFNDRMDYIHFVTKLDLHQLAWPS
jgi:hypothetical protein